MPEREDQLIARIARDLRRPVRIDPALDQRVMAQVEALPRHQPAGAIGAAVRWLLRPRAVRVSPLGGLALAAGLAGLAFLAAPVVRREAAVPAAIDDAAPGVLLANHAGRTVQFVLFAPDAKSVSLVGDFNDWDPSATPLLISRTGGVWSTAVPLGPGRHRYAFVVDGTRWLADPAVPPARDDDFGSPNSVVTVGA